MFGRAGLSYIRAHYIIIIIVATQTVVGDLFSSTHDMETLAHLEDQLLDTLSQYMNVQQVSLNLLHTKLEMVMKSRPSWLITQDLIGDPINAFSLVSRLTREWPMILNLMVSNNVVTDIKNFLDLLPNENDMESAVRSITRMQEVYDLETTVFTQVNTSWGYGDFTARDCFEIGKYLSSVHKYELAKSWFQEALVKTSKKDFTVQDDQVLAHLFPATFYSECKNEHFPGNGLHVLQYLMSQYPNYTLDGESSNIFKQALSSGCDYDHLVDSSSAYLINFSETCQGINRYLSSELRCFYINYNNPRLLIAPFKMEEIHLNPPIVMFHDVVSDQEIQEMKTAFKEVRTRCLILKNGEDENFVDSYYRQCDVGWVEDEQLDTSTMLTRRMGDMTNLSMESSEINQVANYGLGGEFLPHSDVITSQSFPDHPLGLRIATLMFYLSDVESGGSTVFPRLNVNVIPKKGSAILWFNINHRSEELENLLHGACPVYRGSKWVLNKWIHESGQNSDIICSIDETFPKKRYYLNNR